MIRANKRKLYEELEKTNPRIDFDALRAEKQSQKSGLVILKADGSSSSDRSHSFSSDEMKGG